MHSVEKMNHLIQPTLQAENQPAINSKSKPAAVLNWLLRDMKLLPRWPVISVLAMCISVAIGTLPRRLTGLSTRFSSPYFEIARMSTATLSLTLIM